MDFVLKNKNAREVFFFLRSKVHNPSTQISRLGDTILFICSYAFPSCISNQNRHKLCELSTKMLPAFDKKPSQFVKRDSQNWCGLDKTVPTASEFESAFGGRDRSKNNKARQQSRSITCYDSLPTIIGPPDSPRTGTASLALSDECNLSLQGLRTEKAEKLRLCVKRWKKIGSMSRPQAASTTSILNHGFEVS